LPAKCNHQRAAPMTRSAINRLCHLLTSTIDISETMQTTVT